jgi:dihydroflavonol-4-reductase
MKVFLTGGTGFIGGQVARQLTDAGHQIVALVRSPEKADRLRAVGAEIVAGDLSSAQAIADAAAGCDAAIHSAAIYRIGVSPAEANELHRVNVEGTRNALEGLVQAGVPRILYISTVGVFGDTRGQVVDESYQRDTSRGFLSAYDETKYAAHQIALNQIAAGAPVLMVQPAGVYGPRDHSELGATLVRAAEGKLPVTAFPDLTVSMVHVDDVASGIILALEKGKIGESYILSGEPATMEDLVVQAAAIGGSKPPRFKLPTAILRGLAPAGGLIGPAFGMPRNIRELISASDGVTYLASHAKATRELGYQPRALADGLPSALPSN